MDIVEETLQYPRYRDFVEGKSELPQDPGGLHVLAESLFYVGISDKAQEAAYAYSQEQKKLIDQSIRSIDSLLSCTMAALYCDLGGRKKEAQLIWQRLVHILNEIPDEMLQRERRANFLVMGGYALMKDEKFDQAISMATIGQELIEEGKGIFQEARRNTREFGLVEVIRAIVRYKSDPTTNNKNTAQDALQRYKDLSAGWNRMGYPVVFDLQQSYPDIFDPVLPDPDPDND